MNDAEAPVPEPTYFADPALDRVMGFTYALAAEVWVLRDRLARLESLLAASGTVPAGALEAHVPDATERAAAADDRRRFVESLMQNLMGVQISRGG